MISVLRVSLPGDVDIDDFLRTHSELHVESVRRAGDVGCRFAEGWDPAVAEACPPGPHRRDVSYLAFFSARCPAFLPGLSRSRYDSPSMMRS